MKKILRLLLVLCVFGVSHSFAQKRGQALIDSVLALLPDAPQDTIKVLMLGKLSYNYYPIDPNKGIKYGKEGLELAVKLNWKPGIGTLNGQIGINYAVQSQYDTALVYFLKALAIKEEIGDKADIATALGNIANIYFFMSNFPVAIEYHLKALRINEETGNSKGIALNLSNIGLIYKDQSEYNQALDYFHRAVEINEAAGNKPFLANNYAGIGIVYFRQHKYNDALNYYTKALALYEELGNRDGMAKCHSYIGVVYHEQADYGRALEYLSESIPIFMELGNNVGYGDDLSNMGNVYLSLYKNSNTTDEWKNYTPGNKISLLHKAKYYIDSAIVIEKRIDNLKSLKESYFRLSEVYALLGNYKRAYETHQHYKLLSDSTFNIDKKNKITQFTMQYDFDKKEAAARAEQDKKDALALKELQRQKLVRNGFVGGFATMMLFAGVFFMQRNRIKKGKKLSDELLLNILPEEVAEELKLKGHADAKQFSDVTVMFTDFKGFTRLSEILSPADLVEEIHHCFKAFDNIITKHNIEKIKTIGDAYMCAGGLPVVNKSHPEDVVLAALDIQAFMKNHLEERNQQGKEIFEIRIGIHTGPVVAGIVGVKKFAYDIWGDTVNLASRMESSGQAGKVNISSSTYQLVKDKFNCSYRGKIKAKNKGDVDMYFVDSAI